MLVKLDNQIPSWSSHQCQYQIVQLLENFLPVKKILDLGTMLGAYAVAFAKTFPKAEVLAIDRWKGESCGLGSIDIFNTESSFKRFTKKYKNISSLKMDYTELDQIKQIPKDFDFIYFGGPIEKNCYELLSHFNSNCMFAGVKYIISNCDPVLPYTEKCRVTPDKIDFKTNLITTAKHLGRDIIPFGCYNWLMPALK